ncbi:uncharacterized protein LOC124446943 isoform X2 [Xenia sp. Carnegie-2017]|uniref:uncharacterized protein LOC124446943 isoform X2 n=1 Tax=Xenia sp. Carnegie-2017 TaxID=2897299 RepID=UPI001F043F82|nr:uncharacterized protein LOC124446943 isoform X2 [Xenia sp. Carnegie-2017]
MYPVIIDAFEEYRIYRHKLNMLSCVIPELDEGNICPACPKQMNVTPRVCKLHAIFRRGIVNYLSRPYLNLNIFTKMVRKFPAISHQFKEAKDKVGSLIQDPGNELKLKMYALFKQSSMISTLFKPIELYNNWKANLDAIFEACTSAAIEGTEAKYITSKLPNFFAKNSGLQASLMSKNLKQCLEIVFYNLLYEHFYLLKLTHYLKSFEKFLSLKFILKFIIHYITDVNFFLGLRT